jgi:uncharacterized repeat protein (TIGR01451 family)
MKPLIARRTLAILLIASCAFTVLAQSRAGSGYVRTERAFPSGDRNTSSLLLERFTPAEVRLGQEFQYELRLTNLTRGRIEEILLVEQMPAGFALRSITPQARVDGASAAWQISTLGGGETAAITVSGTANRSEELTWCATATFKTGICASTRVVEPRLAIKKVMPPEVMLCDDIPIHVTVSNVGTGAARNVVVEDSLPAGLTAADGKTAFAARIGDLGPGQSREVVVVTRAARPGSYSNTARASEEGGTPIEATASTVVRTCNLAIAKRGPALRFVGRPATFEISVQNNGDAVARDVMLVDNIPPGMEVISAEAGGQYAGGRMTWSLGNLNPSDAKTVRITLKPTQIGRITNTVGARGYCCEASASAVMDVQGIPAILLECVDDPDPVEVGGQTTYDIIVTNQGTATGTNIVIEATLPAEVEYVSAAGPTNGAVAERTVRFAPLLTLAPKAKAVYRVVARGVRTGDARFRVTLKSDQIDSIVEETESTHVYE